MMEDVGAITRLYALHQGLLAARVGAELPAAPTEPRGVVHADDAIGALIQVAAVLDEYIQSGTITPGRAGWACAALMVARECIQPLPSLTSDRTDDPVGDDLHELVEALRLGMLDPDY